MSNDTKIIVVATFLLIGIIGSTFIHMAKHEHDQYTWVIDRS